MIDRPISHLRSANAADALLAARQEFWSDGIRPSNDAAPHLYAARILQSDDRYGRADGLIVHGDEVAWRSVDALFDLAMYAAQLHTRVAHPAQYRRNDCEWCDRIEEFWHVTLVDVITRRRGTTAGELDARIRAQLRSVATGQATTEERATEPSAAEERATEPSAAEQVATEPSAAEQVAAEPSEACPSGA